MSCCDCDLVHTFDFKIIKISKTIKKYKDGSESNDFCDYKGKTPYAVSFRIKRHNRATGQLRRHKKKDLGITKNN